MDGGAPWSTLEAVSSRKSVISRTSSRAGLRSSAATVGSADPTLIMSRLRVGARPGETGIGIEAGPASSVIVVNPAMLAFAKRPPRHDIRSSNYASCTLWIECADCGFVHHLYEARPFPLISQLKYGGTP